MVIDFPGIFLDIKHWTVIHFIEARRVSKTLDFCLFLAGIAFVNMKSKENAGKLQFIIDKYDKELMEIRTRELSKTSS
jgi:hypothetical protein